MDFIFFDIECACVFKETAKICAFGYCLTDENFNIVAKEDILINPKGKFHLTGSHGKEGLVLPYDYTDFKKHKIFPEEYKKICSLLQADDRLVFGHAISNDVKYLNLETRRYKLKPLSFTFYDTQLIYMTKLNSFSRQFGLESITQDLNVEFTPHRAVDDAYATMRIAQAMCEADGVTLPGLIEKYGIIAGKTAGGKTVPVTSEAKIKHAEDVRIAREAKEKAHAEFCNYVEKNRPKKRSAAVRNGPWQGKNFCFSREIEGDVQISKEYVRQIYGRGGMYVFRTENCTVYVMRTAEETARSQAVLASGGSVLTEEAFRQWLEEVPMPANLSTKNCERDSKETATEEGTGL